MKSILITNAYSYQNKGDAGIIISMIDLLREKYPNSTIQIMSRDYRENSRFYDRKYKNVKSIKPFWFIDNQNNTNKLLIGLNALYSLIIALIIQFLFIVFGKKILAIPILKDNEAVKAYLNAELVCSCGGGYLFSTNKWPISIGLYQHLYHIYLGSFFKKKVIMFPQSVGPINTKLDNFLIKVLLKKVDIIHPREEFSRDLMINLSFNTKQLELLPDIAFTLKEEQVDLSRYKISNTSISNIKVGITVLDWHWAYRDPEEGREKVKEYLNKLAIVIDYLIDTYNASIYLIPQVTVGTHDNDIYPSRKLISKILRKENVTLVEDDLSAGELKYIYKNLDIFIGSRMHSCIFAIGAGTPSIGLAYQPKTKGTFEILGLSNYTYQINDFSVDEIKDICEDLIINIKDRKEYFLKLALRVDRDIKEAIYKEI